MRAKIRKIVTVVEETQREVDRPIDYTLSAPDSRVEIGGMMACAALARNVDFLYFAI